MTPRLFSVEGNRQRLDGGAMFGNVPRPVWSRWLPPDELHRVELGCTSFLITDGVPEGHVLLEAGVGAFFEPELQRRFGVEPAGHVLLDNLGALGVAPESIAVVILSHLHFDHAGGLLGAWCPDGKPELVFPRARVVVSRRAWERANAPHLRDRASFIPALQPLLADRLVVIEEAGPCAFVPYLSFAMSDGHTPGMLMTVVAGRQGEYVFVGDLIPGRPWLTLPVTMGYDRFAELVIDEKTALLESCLSSGRRLLLTHDSGCAMCSIGRGPGGRLQAVDVVPRVAGIEL